MTTRFVDLDLPGARYTIELAFVPEDPPRSEVVAIVDAAGHEVDAFMISGRLQDWSAREVSELIEQAVALYTGVRVAVGF